MPDTHTAIPSTQQSLMASLQQGRFYSLYVLAGERTFTAPVVQTLLQHLLTEEEMHTNLEVLDSEHYSQALLLELLQTMPLFGGRKVVHLKDPPFLSTRRQAFHNTPKSDEKNLQEGLLSVIKRLNSASMVLLIETTELDRRSKFYKGFSGLGPVLFLGTVEKGLQGMQDFISSYLAGHGKRMDKQAMQSLLEAIGTEDLIAATKELDKLISAAHQRELITADDVENVVVRHRMEQVYQLTEAMAMGDAGTALKSLHALLEQGQSAILLLHGLVNFFNQMLVMNEFIASLPHGTASGNLRFDAFERQVLPGFKAFFQDNPLEFLQKVPPYGLYKAYLHAFRYDRNRLLSILPELLEADLAIKGEWSTKPEIPLERLVLLGMGKGH